MKKKICTLLRIAIAVGFFILVGVAGRSELLSQTHTPDTWSNVTYMVISMFGVALIVMGIEGLEYFDEEDI